VGKPPRSPYPPDLEDGVPPPTELGDLADTVATELDAAGGRHPGLALQRVELRTCRLTGGDLAEATLTDVVFQDCRLDLVGLRRATLSRVRFADCRLEELELQAATLEDVVFERCSLARATFSEARCRRVEVRDCDLAGLVGIEALRGARMTWNDVLANAGVFAAALEIEVVD
jgi:uncharacterized protein YjbI with pentapeptide repeats